jgi:predicted double-glycine peptidase
MIKIEYKNKSAIKIPIPDFKQEKGYSCAAAALRSILCYYSDEDYDEKYIIKKLKTNSDGTDPFQIIRFLDRYNHKFNDKYKLRHKEYRKMTITELKKCLDKKRPVMIMLQAWSIKRKPVYKKDYKNGHWVVAIG